MTSAEIIEYRFTSADLITLLMLSTASVGVNRGLWPGMTGYRLTRPGAPITLDKQGPAVCVTALAHADIYGPPTYTITGGHRHASTFIPAPHQPCLCAVITLDAAIVRELAMSTPIRPPPPTGAQFADPVTSAIDAELLDVLLRLLRANTAGSAQRVLLPGYLKELVYRLLERDQAAALLDFVGYTGVAHPVMTALTYVDHHLGEPLSVRSLAISVGLSESGLTRSFRRVTGSSPYQYIKEARLVRARELLSTGSPTVAGVARSVGFSSPSHFIKQFQARFGITPGVALNNPGSGST